MTVAPPHCRQFHPGHAYCRQVPHLPAVFFLPEAKKIDRLMTLQGHRSV